MNRRLWVVKSGSQMVCSGGIVLIRDWMSQVTALKKQFGIDVIWVTSGAIASATDRISFNRNNRQLAEKQALSAIGQPIVMDLYNIALRSEGLLGAQVLLTAGDIQDKVRRNNLYNTLEKLLEWDAVPILNENDCVATEEIKFGDNDMLSALIAGMMKAEHLVLLTDVDGLYDSDPKENRHARIIPFKNEISKADLESAKIATKSSRGTGGVFSKLLAAQEALKNGIVTHLVRADAPQILPELARGRAMGTQIGEFPDRQKTG